MYSLQENFFAAAEEGDLAKITELLAQKIDINAFNESGDTALLIALRSNHPDIARLKIWFKSLRKLIKI